MKRSHWRAFARERAASLADILRHPRHALAALQRRVATRLMPIDMPWLPTRLDVEPANDCNLQCDHCQVTHWKKPRAHLDPARFERLLDQLPGLSHVKLQGMGEPLLNKALVPMLKLGEARGIRMLFVTNGTVMTRAILDGLASLRGAHVQVSVDAASKSVFEQVRKGARFERVIETVRALVARRASGGPTVSLAMVLTARNLREAGGVVELAAELGVDWLVLQTFLSDWGKEDMRARNRAVQLDRDAEPVRQAIASAVEVAEREGVALQVSYSDHLSAENPCAWPWTGAYVAANGDVVPCCVVADSDVVKMGNVFEEGFAEIWNGEAYRTLRAQIRDGTPPAFCQNCYRR